MVRLVWGSESQQSEVLLISGKGMKDPIWKYIWCTQNIPPMVSLIKNHPPWFVEGPSSGHNPFFIKAWWNHQSTISYEFCFNNQWWVVKPGWMVTNPYRLLIFWRAMIPAFADSTCLWVLTWRTWFSHRLFWPIGSFAAWQASFGKY